MEAMYILIVQLLLLKSVASVLHGNVTTVQLRIMWQYVHAFRCVLFSNVLTAYFCIFIYQLYSYGDFKIYRLYELLHYCIMTIMVYTRVQLSVVECSTSPCSHYESACSLFHIYAYFLKQLSLVNVQLKGMHGT